MRAGIAMRLGRPPDPLVNDYLYNEQIAGIRVTDFPGGIVPTLNLPQGAGGSGSITAYDVVVGGLVSNSGNPYNLNYEEKIEDARVGLAVGAHSTPGTLPLFNLQPGGSGGYAAGYIRVRSRYIITMGATYLLSAGSSPPAVSGYMYAYVVLAKDLNASISMAGTGATVIGTAQAVEAPDDYRVLTAVGPSQSPVAWSGGFFGQVWVWAVLIIAA